MVRRRRTSFTLALLVFIGGCTASGPGTPTIEALDDHAIEAQDSGPPEYDIPPHLQPESAVVEGAVGPLLYIPLADTEPGMRDLCVDEQAIDVSLDGGDLAADRERMGVDCTTSAATNRFMYVYPDGSDVLVDGPDLASFDPATGYVLPPPDEGLPDTSGLFGQGMAGTVLGIGLPEMFPPFAAADGLEVVPTLSGPLPDGGVVIVVVNGADAFARDVRLVGPGDVVLATAPLTLQPGEPFPLRIDGPAGQTALDALHTLKVVGELSDQPDGARAILFGAPHFWTGSVDEFPPRPGLDDALPGTGDARFFQTFVELQAPNSHPNVAIPEDIRNVTLMAAAVDNGRLTALHEPALVAELDGRPIAEGDQSGHAGMFLDAGVDLVLWAWHTEAGS